MNAFDTQAPSNNALGRRYRTLYSAVVFIPGSADPIYDESHQTAQDRRDGVIRELLRRYSTAMTPREVEDLIAPFGGAEPDTALRAVFRVFKKRLTVIVHLSLQVIEVDAGPEFFYGVVVDYGSSATDQYIPVSTTLFPTAEARLADLRERAAGFTERQLPPDLTTGEAAKAIEVALLATRGSVRLFEARREAETSTEVYRSELV